MPRKPPAPSELPDYRRWKARAVAKLDQRHDVRSGIIPERIWRRFYIRGMTPQKAADQAAVSRHNPQSAADRLRKLLK
jgi:hypothetical protein